MNASISKRQEGGWLEGREERTDKRTRIQKIENVNGTKVGMIVNDI